jgi:hypothetical protein
MSATGSPLTESVTRSPALTASMTCAVRFLKSRTPISTVLQRSITLQGDHFSRLDVGDTESVAMICYSGDTGDVTIRSRWQDEGGRPVIVHAEPAE